MRVNVTAIPSICGTWQDDMRETRQANGFDDASLHQAILSATLSAMQNARRVGYSMADKRNRIILSFEQF